MDELHLKALHLWLWGYTDEFRKRPALDVAHERRAAKAGGVRGTRCPSGRRCAAPAATSRAGARWGDVHTCGDAKPVRQSVR
jgi:hypothetical protein